KMGIAETLAKKAALKAEGDFNQALRLVENNDEDLLFEKWFVAWVRTAFRAKGNKQAINQLLEWSDVLAGHGRETQKKFLSYCTEMFRQALLLNYKAVPIFHVEPSEANFSMEKFSRFVH